MDMGFAAASENMFVGALIVGVLCVLPLCIAFGVIIIVLGPGRRDK